MRIRISRPAAASRRSGRRRRTTEAGALSFALQQYEQLEHPGAGGQQGRRRPRDADEQRRLGRDRRQPEPDRAGCGSGSGRQGQGCGCDGGGIQAIGQEAKNEQSAGALSAALQFGASNDNAPVRVDSKGDDSVRQSNSVDSDATAANLNVEAGCGSGSVGLRWDAGDRPGGEERAGCVRGLAGGAAGCEQLEHPGACRQQGRRRPRVAVEQCRVGCDGAEHQPDQAGRRPGPGGRDRCCDSNGIQAIGQEAKSEQDATALSAALQDAGHDKCGCPSGGNTNSPVRVDSKGDDGSVRQSNSASIRMRRLRT